MINRFIRRAVLARRIGIHLMTTYKWEKSGRLPPAHTLSQHVVGWPLLSLSPDIQALFADDPDQREAS